MGSGLPDEDKFVLAEKMKTKKVVCLHKPL